MIRKLIKNISKKQQTKPVVFDDVLGLDIVNFDGSEVDIVLIGKEGEIVREAGVLRLIIDAEIASFNNILFPGEDEKERIEITFNGFVSFEWNESTRELKTVE